MNVSKQLCEDQSTQITPVFGNREDAGNPDKHGCNEVVEVEIQGTSLCPTTSSLGMLHLSQPSVLIALTTLLISQSHVQLQPLSGEPKQCVRTSC